MFIGPQLSVSESEYRNFRGTNSQELRYPFAGTTVQFWQESSLGNITGKGKNGYIFSIF